MSNGVKKEDDDNDTSTTTMETGETSSKHDKDNGGSTVSSMEDEEDNKKDYSDWPLKNIKEPHPNDVMYGRGGGTNHHPGNKRYRKLVEERKLDYVNSKRLDKPLVALDIIRHWRAQRPPGRFLKLDEKNGKWNDVGDKKAREKTSQALREKAPMIRKQQEEENDPEDDVKAPHTAKNGDPKSTRFAEGTKTEAEQNATQVTKPMLARDHSLGREFLPNNEPVTLDGFTWHPTQSNRSISVDSMGSLPGLAAAVAGAQAAVVVSAHPNATPPPPPHAAYGPPAGRNSSHGSMGMHPTYHTSVGGPPPPHQYYHHPTSSGAGPPGGHLHAPPPPDYYGRITSGGEDPRRQFSSSRMESWGSIGSLSSLPPYPGAQAAAGPSYSGGPPPPPGAFVHHQRSGSWTNAPPPPLPSHGPRHQRSGSWSHGREHSFSMNPLANANTTVPATPFHGRAGSGYWANAPPPSPGPYGGHLGAHPARVPSMGNSSNQQPPPPMHQPMGPYREPSNSESPYGARSPNRSQGTPSPISTNVIPPRTATTPNYNVDMSIIKTWSGSDEVQKTWPGEDSGQKAHPSRQSWGQDQYEQPLNDARLSSGGSGSSNNTSPIRAQPTRHGVLKPGLVKRDTSHQNESTDTKPSIKRAALNRDQSATSNRLKQEYLPEFYKGINNAENGGEGRLGFDTDHEIRMLSDGLEDTNIKDQKNAQRPKPVPLGSTDRMSTMDQITMDLMVKPAPLLAGNRTSTIEALDLNLEDESDSMINSIQEEVTPIPISGRLPKPGVIKEESRLTTMDFLEMVNEPLHEEKSSSDDDATKPLPLTNETVTQEWLANA